MSYIVPRNKPDKCTNCPYMVKDLYDCKLQNGKRYTCIDKQYADCPLIELPPHGRLGDLDKLNIHDISPVDGFCVMGVTEEDIGLVDTVIEAEGEA